MAITLSFFLAPDDERAFFRFLERFELELYPVRIPPDWKPIPVNEEAVAQLPEDAAYLAASKLAPVLVDKIKRGPDKGAWRVDEVRSPVIYYERSRTNEEGELLSGKLWAEEDITPQTGRRDPAPDRFRKLVVEVEQWFKKTCRRGEPIGFYVGSKTARLYKDGLALRDASPKGGLVRPYK